MLQISNFTEAQDALRPYYDNSRTKYTLDVMRALMAYLNNPQNTLRVIHVAGTSGKTSTAYYTAALLRESGSQVGLSVSPHVDTVNERIQINGQPLPEAEFCSVLAEFIELISESGIKPSYFELLVAMTYWEFARRGLDYAVIEVGLGGLLDGTNVVDSPEKVCVITDIGLDHTEILGETLSAIATQKAGIIQQQNPAFMYKQSAEVNEVVASAATANNASLFMLQDADVLTRYDFLPQFQQRNLGLAAAVADFVLQRDYERPLSQKALERAAHITVPARSEELTINGKTVIIDGSHNQQKISALMASLTALHPGQDIAVLCAFVKGSDERWQGGLTQIISPVEHIIFTGFYGEQDLPKSSVDPNALQDFAVAHGAASTQVENDPVAALDVLLERPEPILLITGSFYLLNHVRPRIKEGL